MFLSKKWLEQYLPKGIPVKDDKLAHKLTYSLAEVEQIFNVGDKLKNIAIGEIKTIKPHPKEKKLSVASVDTGTGRKRAIVCAASNIFEGAIVPVALPGARVLNPKQELGSQETLEIKSTEIKKVKSQGMLCSQKELGLTEDHEGIWILPEGTKIGEDLVALISDTILEIENKSLTHRSDAFSHIGIARELSAILDIPFSSPEIKEVLIPTERLPLSVKVKDSKFCPRYTAIALKGVKVSPSPLWLQLYLLSVGLRPVNNIVDATNYVMLDLGQPLHAFDYDKLEKPEIIVRTAKKGEKIITLDEQERELENDTLTISDPSGPIAIAGLMGGLETEVDDKTTNVIIESANFEMYNIRRSSQVLGLRTDASTRFEKGLDPNLTMIGLKRVVNLISEISEGEIASELIDAYPNKVEEEIIEFDTRAAPRLLGIDIGKEKSIDILKKLSLEVKDLPSDTKIEITVPTFRRDLKIKEDIVEEIARILGYDKFKPTLPTRSLQGVKLNKRRDFEKKIKISLQALGFDEIYSYAFISEDHYKNTLLDINECLKLKNPLSPDLSHIRTSLVPSILEKLVLNLPNFEEIEMYESSKICLKEKNKENLPQQPRHITGLLSNDREENSNYYNLKGRIDRLLKTLNIDNINYKRVENIPYLHPNKQAEVRANSKTLGHIGIIHPQVKRNWKINKNTAIFALHFDTLINVAKDDTSYTRISKFPLVRRDLSFWIDKNVDAASILEMLKKANYKHITNIQIIDIYRSSDNKKKKSVTIQITLQSAQKTLEEKDIKADIRILTKEINNIGGKLRKG